jgi:hypothetical protein
MMESTTLKFYTIDLNARCHAQPGEFWALTLNPEFAVRAKESFAGSDSNAFRSDSPKILHSSFPYLIMLLQPVCHISFSLPSVVQELTSAICRGAASSIKGGVWTRPSESLTGSIKGGIWSRPSPSAGSFCGGSNGAEKLNNTFAALSTPHNLVRTPSISGHIGSKSDFTNENEGHDSSSGSSKKIGNAPMSLDTK